MIHQHHVLQYSKIFNSFPVCDIFLHLDGWMDRFIYPDLSLN